MDKLVDGFRVEIHAGSSSSVVKTAIESSAGVVRAAGVESVNQAETKAVNRCFSCKKKVGVLGFKCSVLVNHDEMISAGLNKSMLDFYYRCFVMMMLR
ncbi:hypothetical protein LOK49_LG09G02156 [Camellia lanceoleosa]|uniref:Uncharacterized protein n=1 Tax=Camellia lanceoleosa TaxID=1840588 RepID=A0ACC0GIP9_9ERIC|nr:hypothetical protein LOK49_LG09G02156 [Camellia lanceoleosa]